MPSLLGVGAFVFALVTWGPTGFGALDPIDDHAAADPRHGALVGGTQIAAVAFALSLTGVGRESADATATTVTPESRDHADES